MNNKGFAITGILYTLFILFTAILIAILSALSYKKGILEKTTTKLENTYELEHNNIVESCCDQTNRIANYSGKYIFSLEYVIDGASYTGKCSAYLNKFDLIPENIDPSSSFILTPNDCNKYTLKIYLEPQTDSKNKLILTEVYKFKGR